jgi:hypothetical protein
MTRCAKEYHPTYIAHIKRLSSLSLDDSHQDHPEMQWLLGELTG